MYRKQALTALCSECKAASSTICPACGIVICEKHQIEPDGLCAECALQVYIEVSRTGTIAVAGGGALGGISLIGLFYTLGRNLLMPPAVYVFLCAGLALGIGGVLWGSYLAPKMTERQLKKGFRPRQLPDAKER